MTLLLLFILLAFLYITLVIPAAKSKILVYLLLSVPVINAIADVTTNYFSAGYLTPGALRVLLLMFVIVMLAGFIKKDRTTILIYIFLFYISLLLPLSSDIVQTFNQIIQVIGSLLMFPIGYYLLKDLKKLQLLNYSLLIAAGIIILQYLIAQIFNLGYTPYSNIQSYALYTGGGLVTVTHTLVLFALIVPISIPLLKKNKHKYIFYTIMVLAIVFTVFILNRTSIIALIGGFALYMFLSTRSFKMVKYGMVTLLILIIALPFYGNWLKNRVMLRNPLHQLSREGRVIETYAVLNEMQEGSIKHVLVGSEPFNSGYYFQKHAQYFVLGGDRPLHVDYNRILNGTGIIGLSLYLLIFLSMLYTGIKVKIKKNSFYKEMKVVFLVLLAVTMVISIGGSLTDIGYRSDIMLYMGCLLGNIDSNKNN